MNNSGSNKIRDITAINSQKPNEGFVKGELFREVEGEKVIEAVFTVVFPKTPPNAVIAIISTQFGVATMMLTREDLEEIKLDIDVLIARLKRKEKGVGNGK